MLTAPLSTAAATPQSTGVGSPGDAEANSDAVQPPSSSAPPPSDVEGLAPDDANLANSSGSVTGKFFSTIGVSVRVKS